VKSSNCIFTVGQVGRADAPVDPVDLGAGMVHVGHRVSLGHLGARHAADDGDAQAVEAGIGQPFRDGPAVCVADAFEEIVPAPAQVRNLRVRLGRLVLAQLFEQRHELVMQFFGDRFSAFVFERDEMAFVLFIPGNIPHWIQLGLRQAAPMPARDQKGIPEHGADGFGFAPDRGQDFIENFLRKFGAYARGVFLDAELAERVGGNVTEPDGFGHEGREQFDLEQRGVVGGAIFGVAQVWLQSPFEVIIGVFAAEFARPEDFDFVEPHAEGAPGGGHALKAARGIAMALGQLGGHPGVPKLARVGGTFGHGEFIGGRGGLARAGLAGLLGVGNAQAGGHAPDRATGVAELEPPKRRAPHFVKGCHKKSARVCPRAK
jgi:hypothetical protein